MDFLSNGLFWLFFALTGVFIIIFELGYSGRGILRLSLCELLMAIGLLLSTIVMILSFIFIWWQGGMAIIISYLIWMIIATIVGNFLRRMFFRQMSR